MSHQDLIGINVLVVEDSPTQALLLKRALEEHSIHVQVAKDGIEALQQLQDSLPHVIISDIEMPRMNGYNFCRKVKTNPVLKDIPVILLTHLTDPMDVIRGIECGSDSFLTKPFEINFLLTTIHDARKNRRAHKQLPEAKKLDFFFNGQHHLIQVDQEQITCLLLSTYSNAIQKNLELEQAYQKLNVVHEELQRKNEELKQLDQLKNQFLGMAAHDLRNPLTVIAGYSSLLLKTLEEKIDEKSLKMLGSIKASSALMLQLINDLLDISVIESGIVSLNSVPTDLPALIEENLNLLRVLADKKNIHLLFDCKGPVPRVNCDPHKITQVLNNLVNNAIKFSKAGDNIEIALTPTDKEVILSVKDYGIGISPKAKESLFQPFSKASSTGTAGEKGTGLGLAIAHKIVTRHQGKIWVESEEGKGATFLVALPYEAPPSS